MNAFIPGLGKSDERLTQMPMEQRETVTSLSTFGDPSNDQWYASGPACEFVKKARLRDMFGFDKFASMLDPTGSSNSQAQKRSGMTEFRARQMNTCLKETLER